jgi:hypothetical protein
MQRCPDRIVGFRFIIVAALALASPRLVLAQERVALKLNVPPGTAWTFTQSEQVDLNTTMSAGGQQQQVPQKISRTINGKIEVLESSGGVPSVVRVTIDASSAGQLEQMGQQQPLPLPLAGQTVTVKLQDGTLSHDFKGPVEPSTEQELRGLVEMDEHFLPKQPVTVGDSWTPDREALARQWQVDPAKSKFDVSVTLKELKQLEGKPVAVLEMAATVAGPVPDMPALSGKRDVKGTALVDVATGRVIAAQVNGTLEAAGTQDMQGMQVQISTKGTLSSKSETQPATADGAAGGGAAAVADGEAPKGLGGIIGGGGGGAAAGAGAGAGGAAPAAQGLAGTYSDGQITLDLQEQGGQYSGTITMGDQKFPVKARMQGDQLVGSFTSEGHDFDFTATWDGSTMKFTTGSTDYILKKQGRKNPLAK